MAQFVTTTTVGAATTPPPELRNDPELGSWVVILRSVASEQNGIDPALEYAIALQEKGIDARVFESDDFGSLNPGYWVVYAGEFGDPVEAADHCGEILPTIEEDCYERFIGNE